MAARRCSACNTDWPIGSDYHDCPDCGIVTWYSSSAVPMDGPEGKRRLAHAKFKRWLESDEGKRTVAQIEADNDAREREIAELDAALELEQAA